MLTEISLLFIGNWGIITIISGKAAVSARFCLPGVSAAAARRARPAPFRPGCHHITEAVEWHYIQEIIALSAMRYSPTTTTWSSAPTAARPITGPAGRRSGPVSTPTSTAPALSGCRTRRRKPRRRIWGSASAPTAAPTTPPTGGFATTAAPRWGRTTRPGSRARPTAGRSTPGPAARRLPAARAARRARPTPPSSPAPALRAFTGASCAPTTPSTASRPGTGPAFWGLPA